MPTFGDYEQFNSYNSQPPQQPQHPQPAAPRPQYAPQQPAYTPTPPPQQPYQPPPTDHASRIAEDRANRDRARLAQEAAKAAPSSVKIRNDYIPRAQARQQARGGGMSICPNCQQAIPNEEMSEHVRIEMLNPDWKQAWNKGQQR